MYIVLINGKEEATFKSYEKAQKYLIENLTYYWCEVNTKTVIDDVLQIIDKYRVESEVK